MDSASELEHQLLLARDLELIRSDNNEQLEQQTTKINRMLMGFIRQLRAET